jgi:predicted amidohydrolase
MKQIGKPLVTAPFAYNGGLAMAWLSDSVEVIQQACFPDAGLTMGDDIMVFESFYGKTALCCDADVFQPQYARLAALRGCRLLLVSTGRLHLNQIPSPDALRQGGPDALFLAGPWAAAQANGLAVACAGVGGSCLIVPCLEGNNGLYGLDMEQTELDMSMIDRASTAFPVWESYRPDVYLRFMPS